MQKHRQIEIDENDPFKKGVDLLNRKDEILNLTSIVLNFNDPLVLALNAPWGAGKTTFVKLWQAHLKLEDKQSLYFNAWETDFADDPLIVLVSVLDKWLKATQAPSKIEKWQSGIKKVLPGIAKRTAVAALKAATLNSIDINPDLERIAAEFTGNIASDLLENFDKQSKSVDQFREIIAQALDELPTDQKNLVIFIDELDRCRPTYAIELLERIKHLFNIQRLVFVLSTDIEQLAHCIRAVYGNGFDGKKYLQRFIDLDYSLKKPNPELYFLTLFESLKIDSIFSNRVYNDELSTLKNCFVILTKKLELKPREINALLLRVRLIILSIPENEEHYAPLLVPLLVLRDKNMELYEKYISDPGVADQVISYLLRSNFPPSGGKYEHLRDYGLCQMMGYLIAPNINNDAEFDRLIKPYNERAENNDDQGCNSISAIAKEPRDTYKRRLTKWFDHKHTIERIELAYQINIEV